MACMDNMKGERRGKVRYLSAGIRAIRTLSGAAYGESQFVFVSNVIVLLYIINALCCV